MKIREIEAFDLYGDGTLVIKTNMEEEEEGLRYAWHIMQNRRTIFKIPYQVRPYAVWHIPQRNSYFVKAFVKNAAGERIQEVITFTADRHTSPKLEAPEEKLLTEPPVVENISGPFYKLYLRQTFPENAQYAWYVYRVGDETPVSRQMYTNAAEYIYAFQEPGEYYVKAFILLNGIKDSVKSEILTIQ